MQIRLGRLGLRRLGVKPAVAESGSVEDVGIDRCWKEVTGDLLERICLELRTGSYGEVWVHAVDFEVLEARGPEFSVRSLC